VLADPRNAQEQVAIAYEIGAGTLSGDLCYPSEVGSWQLGDIELSEHVDHTREL
jgi:hypothetical protein